MADFERRHKRAGKHLTQCEPGIEAIGELAYVSHHDRRPTAARPPRSSTSSPDAPAPRWSRSCAVQRHRQPGVPPRPRTAETTRSPATTTTAMDGSHARRRAGMGSRLCPVRIPLIGTCGTGTGTAWFASKQAKPKKRLPRRPAPGLPSSPPSRGPRCKPSPRSDPPREAQGNRRHQNREPASES